MLVHRVAAIVVLISLEANSLEATASLEFVALWLWAMYGVVGTVCRDGEVDGEGSCVTMDEAAQCHCPAMS